MEEVKKEEVKEKEQEKLVEKVEEKKQEEAEKIVEEVSEKVEEAKEREKIIEKSKKSSLKDAASVNATVGFGDNYISAYAIAMGATPTHVGLLTSIPNLIAPLAQLKTSGFMEKTTRKKLFSISILIQSLFWLPIIAVSFLFLKDIKYALLLLVIFYTVYAIFGNFAAPAWISWTGDLVKSREAGAFFGLRNRIGGVTALVSMVTAGFVLDLFKKQSITLTNTALVFFGFATIFFLAMFFRLLSRHFVLQQYEPEFKLEREHYFSFFQFVKNIPKRTYGKFSLYIALVVFATNIVSPYYALYMLRDLKFSYTQFMLINVVTSVATFIFMTRWGKFSDTFGNIKTLRITGFLIPLICFLWPISIFLSMPNKIYFLLAANFLSGFSWAGFNLAAGNFIYDAATPQKRGLCSAYSSILNGLGVVLGATIGSILISHLRIGFMNVILFVSIVSGISRYLVSVVVLPRIGEVRIIEGKPSWKVVPLASEIYNLHLYLRKGFPMKILKHIKKIKIRRKTPPPRIELGSGPFCTFLVL